MDRELRAAEIRMDHSEDEVRIYGYAAVFNTLSEDLGGFREMILPGAFDGRADDDVRALFNHDDRYVLGRTAAGTLQLNIDEKGLQYDAVLPATQTIRDLLVEPMRRGDITQSSFQFTVAGGGDTFTEDDDGRWQRSIVKVSRLYDVSPVTFPAYPEASSGVRNLLEHRKALGQIAPEGPPTADPDPELAELREALAAAERRAERLNLALRTALRRAALID
jgi:HK97 family phage prohead protease